MNLSDISSCAMMFCYEGINDNTILKERTHLDFSDFKDVEVDKLDSLISYIKVSVIFNKLISYLV